MTTDNPEQTAIEKLMKLLDEQRPEMFTEAEANALRNFAKVLLALETLGSVGAVARNVLMWFGVMIGGYLAFRNGILEWISSNLAK